MRYALTFQPIFQERLWGGRRLETVLGKRLPPDRMIGESWEISDYGSESSLVAAGPLGGTSLGELVTQDPSALLGPNASAAPIGPAGRPQFPLLVKWIDARESLSIQVHPPDGHRYLKTGERGKSECWYIADAASDSLVYVGLRRGIDRAALERELVRGTAERCLNRLPVRPGDFIVVPAGVPHAIGGGILLAEIQHTSDTTFRLFDWNRTDPRTGRPRDLQVAEALDCIPFDTPWGDPVVQRSPQGAAAVQLARAEQPPYFTVHWRRMTSNQPIATGCPTVLICVAGTVQIAANGYSVSLDRGGCALLPGSTSYECQVLEPVELLQAEVPPRSIHTPCAVSG